MMLRLYDWKLLRRLKSAANKRARSSGRKSAGGRWWKVGGGGRSSFWLIWLVINLVRIASGNSGTPQTWKIDLFASMSLALAGLAISWSRKLAETLTVGAERRVLWFYPVPESDFFQWTAWRFVTRSVWVPAVAVVVYFVGTEAADANGWAVRIAGPFAEWLLVLCIAIFLARHVDKLPKWLPLGFYVLAGLVFFVPERYGKATTPLAMALPTGWLHVLLSDPRAQEWSGWIAFMALLATAFLFWRALKYMQSIYCREETAAIETVETPAEEPKDAIERFAAEQMQAEEEASADEGMDEEGEAVLPIQATWQKQRLENRAGEVGEFLRDRQWLNPWNWEKMRPIERAVGWCLNAQEKGIVQFLLGSVVPNWSNRWRTSAIAAAVGIAAAIPGSWEFNMVSALAFAVSIGSGVPVLGGSWPATNQGRISGKFSPIFGCYPLSYWAAGWIMFKANLIRTLVWLPLGLTMAVLNARSADITIAASCRLVFQAIVLFLGLAPILLAGKFSKVTNDTVNLRLRILPVLGLFILIVLVVVGLGAAGLIASGWWAIFFLAAATVISWASWAAYGWYYEHCQVDLLREQA